MRSVLVNCVIALLITHSAAHAQIDTGKRVAVPPAAEIESSRAKVREAYSDGYGKPDITANLLAIVTKTRGPADRYALCAEALDLAIRFGNPRGAFASIDRMASMFQIDPISMELPLLTKLRSKVKGKKAAGKLAELACLSLGRCTYHGVP